MIRSYTDFAQKGHIYFQTPSLRRDVFGFLEHRLDELVRNRSAVGATSLLSYPRQFVEKSPSLSIRDIDEELQQEAETFLHKNTESLLKLCALAGDPWERFHTLYLIARFLPQLSEKKGSINSNHLIQAYLLFIHTLSHPELYLKDKDGMESRGCFVLAVKGLYRWDGTEILKNWNTVPDLIKTVQNEVPEEGKKPHLPLVHHAKGILQKLQENQAPNEQDILFLLFTSTILTAVRLELFRKKEQDLLCQIQMQKNTEILDRLRGNYAILFPDNLSDLAQVKAFIVNRLGEPWRFEDVDYSTRSMPSGTTSPDAEVFQSSISSGGLSFSKEDRVMLRRLSRTGSSSV